MCVCYIIIKNIASFSSCWTDAPYGGWIEYEKAFDPDRENVFVISYENLKLVRIYFKSILLGSDIRKTNVGSDLGTMFWSCKEFDFFFE